VAEVQHRVADLEVIGRLFAATSEFGTLRARDTGASGASASLGATPALCFTATRLSRGAQRRLIKAYHGPGETARSAEGRPRGAHSSHPGRGTRRFRLHGGAGAGRTRTGPRRGAGLNTTTSFEERLFIFHGSLHRRVKGCGGAHSNTGGATALAPARSAISFPPRRRSARRFQIHITRRETIRVALRWGRAGSLTRYGGTRGQEAGIRHLRPRPAAATALADGFTDTPTRRKACGGVEMFGGGRIRAVPYVGGVRPAAHADVG